MAAHVQSTRLFGIFSLVESKNSPTVGYAMSKRVPFGFNTRNRSFSGVLLPTAHREDGFFHYPVGIAVNDENAGKPNDLTPANRTKAEVWFPLLFWWKNTICFFFSSKKSAI